MEVNYEKAWKELERSISQSILKNEGKESAKIHLPTLLIIQGSMEFIKAQAKTSEE